MIDGQAAQDSNSISFLFLLFRDLICILPFGNLALVLVFGGRAGLQPGVPISARAAPWDSRLLLGHDSAH